MTKRGIKYRTVTGEILGFYQTPADLFHLQAAGGEAMLECPEVDADAFYVEAGVVLPREAVGATLNHDVILADGVDQATLSGLPASCHLRVNGEVWGVNTGSFTISSVGPGVVTVELVGRYRGGPWMIEARTLEDWKRALRDQINSEHDTRLAGGFWFGGVKYDTDEKSQRNVLATSAGIGLGISLPEDFYWTSWDDQDIPMSTEEFSAFAAAMWLWGEALHRHKRALKAALESMTSAAELRSLDPTAGWPSNVAEDYLTP
mgnify:CR=1 FL=1